MAKAKKTTSRADEIEKRLTTPVARVAPIPPEDFVSTGSTQLNLAFTGSPTRGVPKGCYLYLVGDSGSMKTWLAFNLLAEAARNRNFDQHAFVYDGPENGAWMEVPKFFGPGVAERIVPPRGTGTECVFSQTVQEFYYNLDDCLDKGPVIYIEDSMDALNAEEDEEQFEKEKQAHRNDKDVKGSYGVAKAKSNSKNINRVVQRLRETGSILVVISQTRDKIGSMFAGQKTRSGGRSLRFYAHLEVWTSIRKPLTRTHMGKEREYGSLIRAEVHKNRINGWEGELEIPFIKGHGIDDVGGMVRYLIDEEHWESDGKDNPKVSAPEFNNFEGTAQKLIERIQESGDEHELQLITAKVWREIAEGSAPLRKPRYT